MTAGRLDKRIIFERKQIKTDMLKQQITEWVPILTVWASVEPLSGREYWAAAQSQAENTVKFRIRYRKGITSKLRIRYAGRVFDIVSVLDTEEAHKELVIMGRDSDNAGKNSEA